jgi:hypothetical protein
MTDFYVSGAEPSVPATTHGLYVTWNLIVANSRGCK